jgi:hypothetical protein
MPVLEGQDPNGHFMAWGSHGTRYYFNPNSFVDKHEAYLSAQRQGIAIHSRARSGVQSPLRNWDAYQRSGKGLL